jgi:hypothetical protein
VLVTPDGKVHYSDGLAPAEVLSSP